MKLTLAIDFDGTLCEHEYPNIGKPILPAIETLKKLREEIGCELILWTCREGVFLEKAVMWCHKLGLFFDAINTNAEPKIGFGHPKIIADFYIDDRAPGWHSKDDETRWKDIYDEVTERHHLTFKNIIKKLTP